jgi:hypothetical protein
MKDISRICSIIVRLNKFDPRAFSHFHQEGMAPTPVSANAVNAAAKGKKWDFKLLSGHLCDAISKAAFRF